MKNDSKQNVIQQKLETIQKFYESFSRLPEAKTLVWLLEQDEFSIIEQFFKHETSIVASSADLFLKFEAPFVDSNQYARALFDELATNISNYRAQPANHQITINWQPQLFNGYKQTQPNFFFSNIAGFAKGIQDFEENVLVYLAPAEVKNFPAFEDWIATAIEDRLPDGLRLMLVDFNRNQKLSRLPKRFNKEVQIIVPELDMPQAMKEIATAAGGNHPGVQFQHHFIDLSNAAARGDVKKVESSSNKALSIAMDQGWTHLQVAVFTTVGSAWLGKGDYKKALTEFESAEKIAKTSYEGGDALAGRLLANTLFSKGAVYVTQKNYGIGATTYESIVPVLEKVQDPYLSMEAWRMAAFCHENGSNYTKATECNQKAFLLGESLEEDIRKHSTMPFIATSLIQLYERRAAHQQADEVEQKMTLFFGRDWKSLAKLKN